MEVQELYEKLVDTGVFGLPADVKIIQENVKQINGSVRDHSWNIRGLWAVFIGSWSLFLLWLRNNF